VQIETNGTLFRKLPKEVSIVCSPKPSKFGYKPIREDLLERISAIKFLISKNHQYYCSVPDWRQNFHDIPIYIQPMDEQNDKTNTENINLAIEIAQKYGYRLSVQTHKFLDIP
jgi:organic radical activating enzyme